MRRLHPQFDTSFFLGAVYFFIALATFKHTMWAGSMVFEGAFPKGDPGAEFWWWVTGILVAIGIDVGMMTTAHVLTKPKGRMKALVFSVAFVVAAMASLFTQIMYAASHTSAFTFGDGVTPYWRQLLQPIMDARPVLMAAFLPLFAIIYTLARITVHEKPAVEEDQGTVDVEIASITDKLLVDPSEITRSKAIRRLERGGLAGKIAVAKKHLEAVDVEPEPKPKATVGVSVPDGELITFSQSANEPNIPRSK